MVDFLHAHWQGERYLLATPHLMLAALIIVETGQPVIATGGFMGSERVLTPAQFADMVARRQVRYALLPPIAPPGGQGGGVIDRGPTGYRVVSPALWRPDLPVTNIAAPAVSHPRKAADPRTGAETTPGPINVVRTDLRQMELYDFRPDSDDGSSGRQPGR